MMDINDVCDYIIVKVTAAGESLNFLKLQKLVYYCQAWHLAIHKQPLFDGKFQAWIHGPVSRELFDRFKEEKSLYTEMDESDTRLGFDVSGIVKSKRLFINDVLETYAGLSGTQLEEMSHSENPWIEARKGHRPTQRCEVEISETTMQKYYEKRLS